MFSSTKMSFVSSTRVFLPNDTYYLLLLTRVLSLFFVVFHYSCYGNCCYHSCRHANPHLWVVIIFHLHLTTFHYKSGGLFRLSLQSPTFTAFLMSYLALQFCFCCGFIFCFCILTIAQPLKWFSC